MASLTPVLSWAESCANACVDEWREDLERLEIDELEPDVLAAIADAIREAASRASARARTVTNDPRISAAVHSSVMTMLDEPRTPFAAALAGSRAANTELAAYVFELEEQLEGAMEDANRSFESATNDAIRSAACRVQCSRCYDAVMGALLGGNGTEETET